MALAGFRALPPIDDPFLDITSYDPGAEAEMRAFMNEKPSGVALVQFNVLGRELLPFFDLTESGPWKLTHERVPELNRHLMDSVRIVQKAIEQNVSD
jgi:hypothetical protein